MNKRSRGARTVKQTATPDWVEGVERILHHVMIELFGFNHGIYPTKPDLELVLNEITSVRPVPQPPPPSPPSGPNRFDRIEETLERIETLVRSLVKTEPPTVSGSEA